MASPKAVPRNGGVTRRLEFRDATAREPAVPGTLSIAAPPQAVGLVLIVNEALTAAVPVIFALAIEKQPFVNAGLLVTDQEMVPVYPSCGVTVIVEAPALGATIVGLVEV